MFSWCLLVVNLVIAVPVLVLALECLVATWPIRCSRQGDSSSRHGPNASGRRPSVWFLIPAHDEEQAIGPTLRSVQRQLEEGDAVCVVADNCSDRTAPIARDLGAEVVERTDAVHRGKGYALEAGLAHMRQMPRPVVIVIDADCLLEEYCVRQLAEAATLTGQPIQARYLMAAPPLSSPRDVISRFAVIVKNLVRPVGLQRLGGPALLTGSGMAFPWHLLSCRNLATGHIVEDMQLGFDLLLEGNSPRLVPTAGIQGSLAESGRAAITQRTRWEHGHMQVMVSQLPRLLWGLIRRPRWDVMLAALDLTVPPLSFLAVIWSLAFATTVALFFLQAGGAGVVNLSVVVGFTTGLLLFVGIFTAWWCYARREISLWTLLLTPLYVLTKLPIYIRFLLFRREKKWIRTTRADGTLPESGG